MCDPAGHPRNREQHRNIVVGIHGLVNQPGVEVTLVQLPFTNIRLRERCARTQPISAAGLTHQVKHFIRHTLDNPRAGVVILVTRCPKPFSFVSPAFTA